METATDTNVPLTRFAGVRGFFHESVDVRIPAAIRIGYATLLLINILCWWPDLDRWFSEVGVLSLAASRQVIDTKCLTLFQLLPADATTLRIAYGVFVAQSIGLLLGWYSRVNAIGCYAWLVSFQHRNSLLFEGEDTLFRIIGFLLIFMPMNRAWSIDNGRHNREQTDPTTVDGWSIRLLQFEMTMLYFSAGWCKWLGAPWREGTALYYVTRLDDYWGRFPLPDLITDTPWIVRGLTWSTLAIEFSIPVLVWFAPTRRYALGLAFVFHLACDYTMHLFLFHWIMLVGWVAFVRPEDFAWLKGKGGWPQKKREDAKMKPEE